MATYGDLAQFEKHLERFYEVLAEKYFLDLEGLKTRCSSFWSPKMTNEAASEEAFVAGMDEFAKYLAETNMLTSKLAELQAFTCGYWQRFLATSTETDLVKKFTDLKLTKRRKPASAEGDTTKPKVPKVKKESTCKAVYKSGANKGKECGKACVEDFCGVHQKTSASSSITMNDDPDDPIEQFSQDGEVKIPTMAEVIKREKKRKMQSRKPHKGEICDKIIRARVDAIHFYKNIFNNYELKHDEHPTPLVFDPALKRVVGTQRVDGNIQHLTYNDIQLCKELRLDCVLPPKLGDAEVKKDAEHDIEDDYEEISEDEGDD